MNDSVSTPEKSLYGSVVATVAADALTAGAVVSSTRQTSTSSFDAADDDDDDDDEDDVVEARAVDSVAVALSVT